MGYTDPDGFPEILVHPDIKRGSIQADTLRTTPPNSLDGSDETGPPT